MGIGEASAGCAHTRWLECGLDKSRSEILSYPISLQASYQAASSAEAMEYICYLLSLQREAGHASRQQHDLSLSRV